MKEFAGVIHATTVRVEKKANSLHVDLLAY
jgi:hypothetical protein